MKHLKPMVFSLTVLFCMTLTSCKYTTDSRIDAFEKSIVTLEKNYKDLTPGELEKALSLCEKQMDALNNSDNKFSQNQKDRISNLKGRYHRLLLKIELHTIQNNLFDGETLLEYLKGLIAGN